jgi:hypothetical protein
VVSSPGDKLAHPQYSRFGDLFIVDANPLEGLECLFTARERNRRCHPVGRSGQGDLALLPGCHNLIRPRPDCGSDTILGAIPLQQQRVSAPATCALECIASSAIVTLVCRHRSHHATGSANAGRRWPRRSAVFHSRGRDLVRLKIDICRRIEGPRQSDHHAVEDGSTGSAVNRPRSWGIAQLRHVVRSEFDVCTRAGRRHCGNGFAKTLHELDLQRPAGDGAPERRACSQRANIYSMNQQLDVGGRELN